MYKEHQARIQEYAKQSPESFARVQSFVICTIQQQLSTAVKQAVGERELNSFGFKLRAQADIRLYKNSRYEIAYKLYNTGQHDEHRYINALRHQAGIDGIVDHNVDQQICANNQQNSQRGAILNEGHNNCRNRGQN